MSPDLLRIVETELDVVGALLSRAQPALLRLQKPPTDLFVLRHDLPKTQDQNETEYPLQFHPYDFLFL